MAQKAFLFILLSFIFNNCFAQIQLYNAIEKAFNDRNMLGSDWGIALNIEQSGRIVRFDSLGNRDEIEPNGTYVLYCKNGALSVQKLEMEYFGLDSTSFNWGKLVPIGNCSQLNCTADSFTKIKDEWIYPLIYKDEKLNTYSVQEPADHAPRYHLYLKIPGSETFGKWFSDNEFEEKVWFSDSKNLNYKYNSNTCLYRLFKKLYALLKQGMRNIPEIEH